MVVPGDSSMTSTTRWGETGPRRSRYASIQSEIDGACLWMNKQIFERSGNLGEASIRVRAKDTVVPFHAALQRRPSQIRAADECGALTVRVVEDVGLRMERSARRFKHAELQIASKVHQVDQGIRVGRVEIVAGDDAHAAASIQQVAKVLANQGNATLQDEGDGKIGTGSLIQARP